MPILKLTDGRVLDYSIYGDPQGTPVVFCHGFSDSKLLRNPNESLTQSLGVRVIAVNEPGVGKSSPKPGRKMVEWGADITELADYLKLESFNVAGHSGGSPHALAIAYALPNRVKKIVLTSPVVDFNLPGATKLLRNKELKLFVKLRHEHHILKEMYKMGAKVVLKNPTKFVKQTAKGDPSDAETYLKIAEQQKMFEQSFVEGFAQKGEGVYEMTLALWDWGFEPKDIHQPTTVFIGDADDILDPKMPKQLADLLPNSTVKMWRGAGHYGFVDTPHWVAFLSAVQ